jgi:hypothetical protein
MFCFEVATLSRLPCLMIDGTKESSAQSGSRDLSPDVILALTPPLLSAIPRAKGTDQGK